MIPNSPSGHAPWWRCPACLARTVGFTLALLLVIVGAITLITKAVH